MEGITISEKLNKIIQSFSNQSISFYEGEYNTLKSVLDNICPFSKIALVYSNDSFNKYSIFSEKLTKCGYKVINVVENDKALSVEKAGNLFSLSENVRCVVGIGCNVFSLVTYYSAMRKLLAVYYADNFNLIGALKTRVEVFNGVKKDYVITQLNRHIILDTNKIYKDDKNISKAYSFVMSGFVSMIDYRIAGYVGNNELDSNVYNLYKIATLDCYNVFKYSLKKQPEIILTSLLTALSSNIISNGSLTDFSSISMASLVYGNENIVYCPELTKRLLGLYSLAFSGKYNNTLPIRDYLGDQIALGNIINLDKVALSKSILKNGKIFKDNIEGFSLLMSSLQKETDMLYNATTIFENTFYALGGEQNYDNDKLNTAISLCGSLPKVFNGITIVKESGILD